MNITKIERKLVEYAEKNYIETGYMYSGNISPNIFEIIKICGKNNSLNVLFSLVKKHILQKRNCQALSFELVIPRRKKLIKKHNLSKVWQKNAPYFYPNDEHGEVTHVMKRKNQS